MCPGILRQPCNNLQNQLQNSAKEFDTTASGASSLLHSLFGFRRSGTGSSTGSSTGSASIDADEDIEPAATQQGGGAAAARRSTARAPRVDWAPPSPAAEPAAAAAAAAPPVAERAPAQSLLGALFGVRRAAAAGAPDGGTTGETLALGVGGEGTIGGTTGSADSSSGRGETFGSGDGSGLRYYGTSYLAKVVCAQLSLAECETVLTLHRPKLQRPRGTTRS